jgi:outer membrane protein assembly factor BamA
MNSCISSIFKGFVVLSLFFSSVRAQTDSSAQYRINSATITGNKKTKDKIIVRELVKNANDTLILKNLPAINKRSEFNIFNTQLFIYDSIIPKINEDKTIDLTIKVKERWYIWPIPFVDFLDRNVNAWLLNRDPARLNYGLAVNLENFTGVKDRLTLIAKTGYANQVGFNYRLPYLNSKQKLGGYIQTLYTEYNKLQYITLNSKQQFLTSATDHLRIEKSAKMGLFYRPHLFLQHSVDLYYYNITISDSVRKLNPNYFFNHSRLTEYVGIQYKFAFDDRDNKIYPLRGTMLEGTLIKDGFEVQDNSPLNTVQGILALKNYFPIGRRFNFANQLRGRYLNSAQQLPFAFNQALGYSNYIRGYEYNVIDGQNYFLIKNSLRFQLIRKRFHEIGALKKLKPFSTIPFYAYLNIFYDGAYVKENYYKTSNFLANSWQHGYGIGLDMVTYYDFVLRLEYSVNKQNLGGFYIHLTSGF